MFVFPTEQYYGSKTGLTFHHQVFNVVFDVCFALTTKYGGGRHIIYITDARMLQIVSLETQKLPGFHCIEYILIFDVLFIAQHRGREYVLFCHGVYQA